MLALSGYQTMLTMAQTMAEFGRYYIFVSVSHNQKNRFDSRRSRTLFDRTRALDSNCSVSKAQMAALVGHL